MAVTRRRLTAPPERGATTHGGEAPAVPVVIREAPAIEARQVRDRIRVIDFFAGRTGQRLHVGQVVTATSLPAARVLQAVDALVEAGFLQQTVPRQTEQGHVRTWRRPGPEEQGP